VSVGEDVHDDVADNSRDAGNQVEHVGDGEGCVGAGVEQWLQPRHVQLVHARRGDHAENKCRVHPGAAGGPRGDSQDARQFPHKRLLHFRCCSAMVIKATAAVLVF